MAPGLPAVADAWWRGAVIYQIYPRSFRDSTGDGVGDLPGIIAGLPYVAGLGVDAIWLSPVFRSPMRDFGYDIADHCAVDPLFGTLADFDRLVERAHALGLRVIIDLVCGHTSDAHPWFRASRAGRGGETGDWYVWADPKPDGTPPNNWLAVFGGPAWSWSPERRQYYLHHFLPSQPALNLHAPAVVAAMVAVAEFWRARGVDGFRFDAVDFLLHDPALSDNPPQPPADGERPAKLFALQAHVHDMIQPGVVPLLRAWRAFADRHPGTALIGEVSSQAGAYARIAAYTQPGMALDTAYTLRPLRRGRVEQAVGEALAEIAAAGDTGWPCWAFSNHDVERVASRWNPLASAGGAPPRALVRLLLTLLVTLRGTVSLYQGEELGLGEARLRFADLRDPFGLAFYPVFPGRDGCRTPLPWRSDRPQAGFSEGTPWLPVPPEHLPLSIAAQENDPESPLVWLRRLLRWRKTRRVLLTGALRQRALAPPLIGFERFDENERLLLVFNPAATPARVPCGEKARAVAAVSSATLEKGVIALPAFGIFIAELPAAS